MSLFGFFSSLSENAHTRVKKSNAGTMSLGTYFRLYLFSQPIMRNSESAVALVCFPALTPFLHNIRYTMTLTRGSMALYPCAVCLVPANKLANHDSTYPNRTQEMVEAIFAECATLNATQTETKLQGIGIRHVKVRYST